ncbi:MAG: hypothetical protein QM750_23785 [Rubrivivax sp.]
MKLPRHWAVLLLLPTGAALWLAAAFLGGRREAWDSGVYWTLAYPLALLISAVMGRVHPTRTWHWPAALFFGQFLGMCLRNGGIGSLWPLGLVAFAVLSLPGVLAARLAARGAA